MLCSWAYHSNSTRPCINVGAKAIYFPVSETARWIANSCGTLNPWRRRHDSGFPKRNLPHGRGRVISEWAGSDTGCLGQSNETGCVFEGILRGHVGRSCRWPRSLATPRLLEYRLKPVKAAALRSIRSIIGQRSFFFGLSVTWKPIKCAA